MHRVSYSPGEQRFAKRFSIALLIRPYKEVTMERLVGSRIPSIEQDRLEGQQTGDNVEGSNTEHWELEKMLALKAEKRLGEE